MPLMCFSLWSLHNTSVVGMSGEMSVRPEGPVVAETKLGQTRTNSKSAWIPEDYAGAVLALRLHALFDPGHVGVSAGVHAGDAWPRATVAKGNHASVYLGFTVARAHDRPPESPWHVS